jgi:hypothetical protein
MSKWILQEGLVTDSPFFLRWTAIFKYESQRSGQPLLPTSGDDKNGHFMGAET